MKSLLTRNGRLRVWVIPTLVALIVACAAAAVLISPRSGGQTLFWGLGASVAGFIVNCLLVTPKREVVIVDDADGIDVADGVDGADLVGAGGGGDDE